MEHSLHIHIPESEIKESFIRAGGPGGQNVNKISSAVQLAFDVKSTSALPVRIKQRLIDLAGKRISGEGILIIEASRYRSQEKNRVDARKRLADLIRMASYQPRRRISTKPSQYAKQKRLDNKKKRAHIKHYRKKFRPGSDI